MVENLLVEYTLIAALIVLMFFAFLIGTNRMLQVIVSAGFIIVIVLWFSWWLQHLIDILRVTDSIVLFDFTHTELAYFIESASLTLRMLLTGGLLFYVLQYMRYVGGRHSSLDSRLIQILLVPLAIISMVLSLIVAVLGTSIFAPWFIANTMALYGSTSIVSYTLWWLPWLMVAQGLITLFLVFDKKVTLSDVWYDDI